MVVNGFCGALRLVGVGLIDASMMGVWLDAEFDG